METYFAGVEVGGKSNSGEVIDLPGDTNGKS